MKNIVSSFLFVILGVFSVNLSVAQVVQEQANKLQLINGVKLTPSTSANNLTKIEPTTVTKLVNKDDSLSVPKKEKKIKKLPKILKYGNRNTLKKEDDE